MEFQCELRNCWQQKEKVLFTLCGEFTVKAGWVSLCVQGFYPKGSAGLFAFTSPEESVALEIEQIFPNNVRVNVKANSYLKAFRYTIWQNPHVVQ